MFSKINTEIAERLDARRNGDKGFTLVELLVVVIIIGILAAIAIPVFLNQRESSWKSSVEADLRNAALALESYGTDNNGSLSDLTTGGALSSATDRSLALADTIGFTASEGNILSVAIAADQSYVITGENVNLTGDNATYNSAAGGLQDDWNP